MADSNRCVIRDNICSWDAGAGGQDYGISLWAPTTASCSNNAIINNRVYNSYKSGISLQASSSGACSSTKISGNQIFNPNQSAAATEAGVNMYGLYITNTHVTDNNIVSTDGKLPIGIREAQSTYSRLRNNTIIGATTPFLKDVTTLASNNGQNLSSTGAGYNATVTSEAGAITTLGALATTAYEQEKMVYLSGSIAITTIGTATGDIRVSLPFTSSGKPAILSGYEVSTGAALRVLVGSFSFGTLSIRKYDGTPINVSGSTFQFSGWYERA